MLDLAPLVLSIPSLGVRSVNIPFVNPLEAMEVQVIANYAGTGGTAATDTLTITGTGGVGQNLNGVINGVPFTYIGAGGDTTTTIVATNVTAYLKTLPGIAGVVTPVASTNTVVLTANIPGTAGNSIGASAAGTGTLVGSFGTATLVGGVNPTVSATTGVNVAFSVSYNNGVTWVATAAAPFSVPGVPLISQSNSRVIHCNDPYRMDPGTTTNLLVTLTNTDTALPVVVTVLTERQV